MATKPLLIRYSGTLDGFEPSKTGTGRSKVLSYLWTYQNLTVDPSTRSGYYLIEAIKILRDFYKVSPQQLKIHFWGKISPINQKQVYLNQLENYFVIEGYKSKAESKLLLSEADILFLPLEKTTTTKHETLFIPGKLYEYLETRKPILALCEESDCARIIEKSGLGIIASPDRPEQISQKLNQYIADPKLLKDLKANDDYINSFSFSQITRKLADVFDELRP